MKATFPHMGTAHLSLTTLLDDLGLEPVVPPLTNQHSLALGTKYAPEFACFPLKVNLGNYLEAINAGAELILMVGGVGPCRLGYYAEVQREILRGLGYGCQLISLEPPQHRWGDFWRTMRRFIPVKNPVRIGTAVAFAVSKIAVVDKIERLTCHLRPRERRRGETSRAWAECQALLAPVSTWSALRLAVQRCHERMEAVEIERDRQVLHVALCGEVFMVLEPAVNFHLEGTLGELGVEVHREIYLSSWINQHLLGNSITRGWYKRVRALARPYLANFVGGHALESVAQAVDAAVNGLDGLIHLSPFTCMPEIVTQSVLPMVSKSLKLPVMSIIIDEHAAETGIMTRLEAFLDLSARRRQKELAFSATVFSRR